MKTIIVRRVIIILCLFALILATLACIGDPTPGGWQPTEGDPFSPAYATGTYGAEQFHAQLTALAKETEQP